MKISAVLSSLLILFFSCKDKEKIIEVVDEVPNDIFNIQLCETLSSTVMSTLTESKNNRQAYPGLFSDNVQQQILITKETEVFISFVTEGAARLYLYSETILHPEVFRSSLSHPV